MGTFKFRHTGRQIAKSDLVDLGLALGAPCADRQGVPELRRGLETWVLARRALEAAVPPATVAPAKTLSELAREALEVQNACNLSGVVHSFSRVVSQLRACLPEAGTTEINEHPIVRLWVDKLASLSGTQNSSSWAMEAYRQVRDMAKSDVTPVLQVTQSQAGEGATALVFGWSESR